MSPIKWMARNHVAANLLMVLLLAGGLLAAFALKVEVFPEFELDMVTVSVVYPGAGPSEVEEGVVQPIEEAINGVEGVKRVLSTATEGMASVTTEVIEGEDVDLVLQDIKAAVDRIITFPQQIERPIVRKVVRRRSVMTVVVHGALDELTLREQAEDLRDRFVAHPDITVAELSGVPPYEISIEVAEETLRKYGLTLDGVAAAVRAASQDLPGGTVKTRAGEVLLRTKERRYTAAEYRDVVVLSKPDGTMVRLRDLATVRDTFMETDEEAHFLGDPAALVEVYRVGEQTPSQVAAAVKQIVAKRTQQLPDTVGISIWYDRSEVLQDRMNLLLRNAGLGLGLVIIILGLFLQPRLAFWVTLGIPLSMVGALMFMPWLDVSINMISLFAFIVVLGIVVDDAIVVGENAFSHHGFGKPMPAAAPDGAREVARPVTFSILTTVAAFAPLLFTTGIMGKFMWSMPVIVIAVLLISLVESLFVLPAHLSGCRVREATDRMGPLSRLHHRFGLATLRFIRGPYRRLLAFCLRNRYGTLALALALLALTVGLYLGGYIKAIFMPEIEGDVVHARITMPFGTPPDVTRRQIERIERLGMKLVGRYDRELPEEGATILRNSFNIIGGHLRRRSVLGGGGHLGEVAFYLSESGERNVESDEFARRWRAAVGEVPGAESVDFNATMMHMGDAIDIQLSHDDFAVLEAASARLKRALAEFDGLRDIADSYEMGKRELKLTLRPEARSLGITEQDLGRQVRAAFYGAEALRIQRGRSELRVMVRYPLRQRRSLADVDSMRIRTRSGGEVPFARAAHVEDGRGYSYIQRSNRKRVINVTAKANLKQANPQEIVDQLRATVLPQLEVDYPGLTYDLEGKQRERRESMGSLWMGFVAALSAIYGLLAIPFRSYAQPLLVMTAIPFGIIGAVAGHLALGYDLSLISGMGIVALTGVVVNDSLVLIDFVNRNRRDGTSGMQAVLEGAQRRFRPIMLTTLTTFFALIPMLAETSVQARFLVPMAISLAFGVLFGTFITLLLIPAMYLILEDIKRAVAWIWGRPGPASLSHAADTEETTER